MQIALIVLLAILLLLCIVLILLFARYGRAGIRHKQDMDHTIVELESVHEQEKLQIMNQLSGRETELKRENERVNRLLGEKEQNERQLMELKSRYESGQHMISRLEREKGELEQRERGRQQEIDRQLQELENSRKSLEQERERVIELERKKAAEDEANRNRIWAMHEQQSIMCMREVCAKPEYGFINFDNTNLPEGFDTKLKPDFMIEFLDQFIIFDAKFSKSTNLQGYLQTQVKSTAQKIRKSLSVQDIYKTVFFVIPTQAADSLKSTAYFEAGYTFYIITVEAFEPVVAAFRKLRDYDLADAYDPAERENVINLIALFDNHIRQQNAVNIVNTLRGLKVMSEKQTLPEDMSQSVDEKRKALRLDTYKPSELHRLMNDPTQQLKEIASLVSPGEPAVKKEDIGRVVNDDEAEESEN